MPSDLAFQCASFAANRLQKCLLVQKIYVKKKFKGFAYQEFLEFEVQTCCKQEFKYTISGQFVQF